VRSYKYEEEIKMARVTEKQKQEIRQLILKVSKQHFLTKGYDATKTKDIAREAGIAEGTLFNYFDTKTDIFLEAMASGYIIDGDVVKTLDFGEEIADIIYDLIYRTMKPLAKMPRKIIKEIFTASITLAKRKPELMKKIVQLDYKLIEDMEGIIKRLIDEKRLKECDPKVFSEIFYSIVVVEVVIYLYEEKISQEKMLENVKEKIRFTLEGHLL